MTAALRIFLTMCISIETYDHSFSKLKLGKNISISGHRSDACLSSLAALSIERELAEQLDYRKVIKVVALKARKVQI